MQAKQVDGSTRWFITPEGKMFRTALLVLREAAEASDRAVTAQMGRLDAMSESSDPADGTPPSDSDEPTLEEWVNDQLAAADASGNEARKAFAVAAYHSWEHAVNRGVMAETRDTSSDKKPTRLNGRELDNKAREFGWTPDRLIPGLRALVNLLKHDNKERLNDLKKEWPRNWGPPANLSDDAEIGLVQNVRLDQALLLEIFDIVERSGPPLSRPASPEEQAWFDERWSAFGRPQEDHSA